MRGATEILRDLSALLESILAPAKRAAGLALLKEVAELLFPLQWCTGKPRSSGWEKFAREWLTEHPTCAACGGTVDCQVHHIQPFHLKPELELCKTNVVTLCMAPHRLCHFSFGHCFYWPGINPHVLEDSATHLSRVKHRLD